MRVFVITVEVSRKQAERFERRATNRLSHLEGKGNTYAAPSVDADLAHEFNLERFDQTSVDGNELYRAISEFARDANLRNHAQARAHLKEVLNSGESPDVIAAHIDGLNDVLRLVKEQEQARRHYGYYHDGRCNVNADPMAFERPLQPDPVFDELISMVIGGEAFKAFTKAFQAATKFKVVRTTLSKVKNAFSKGPKNAKLPENLEGFADTDAIRFTQNGVTAKFRDDHTLQETIDALRSGKLSPNDLPPIRVFEKDGLIYSLDNRRLFAAREAGVPIRVTPATVEEITRELTKKMTTKNNGRTVVVRGLKQEN